jgi:glutathione S-transferase
VEFGTVSGMRLYYRVGTGRPMRVAWTLEEIGAPYECVSVSAEEAKQPEHLARHPLGRVPVLEQDDQIVFESAGVCLHLADQYPDAGLIAPVGSHDRALTYQWTIFAMTEVEVPIIEFLRNRESDPERAAAGLERFNAAATALEQALEGHEFLLGSSLTVADIVMRGVLGLAEYAQIDTAAYPNLTSYMDRLKARPAFQRALASTESVLRS